MVPGSFIDGRPMKPFSTLWMDPALLKVPTRVVSMMSPKNSVLKDLSELFVFGRAVQSFGAHKTALKNRVEAPGAP
jgi:hypothetical protein